MCFSWVFCFLLVYLIINFVWLNLGGLMVWVVGGSDVILLVVGDICDCLCFGDFMLVGVGYDGELFYGVFVDEVVILYDVGDVWYVGWDVEVGEGNVVG